MPVIRLPVTPGATRARRAEAVRDVTATCGRAPGKGPGRARAVVQAVADEDRGFAGRLTDDRRRGR